MGGWGGKGCSVGRCPGAWARGRTSECGECTPCRARPGAAVQYRYACWPGLQWRAGPEPIFSVRRLPFCKLDDVGFHFDVSSLIRAVLLRVRPGGRHGLFSILKHFQADFLIPIFLANFMLSVPLYNPEHLSFRRRTNAVSSASCMGWAIKRCFVGCCFV